MHYAMRGLLGAAILNGSQSGKKPHGPGPVPPLDGACGAVHQAELLALLPGLPLPKVAPGSLGLP